MAISGADPSSIDPTGFMAQQQLAMQTQSGAAFLLQNVSNLSSKDKSTLQDLYKNPTSQQDAISLGQSSNSGLAQFGQGLYGAEQQNSQSQIMAEVQAEQQQLAQMGQQFQQSSQQSSPASSTGV